MAGGLGIFAILLWYNEFHRSPATLISISGLFLLVGVLFPPVSKPVYVVWMLLARILGYVNTHILLAIIFYTMFTVIGLAMRRCGRDPMKRKLRPDQESYWERRSETQLPRDHFERQF